MTVFLFMFGFETPAQHRNNRANGWDDEDSQSIFIEAVDAETALAWGRQIAENYVRHLWRAHPESAPSWDAGRFAHWIETDSDRIARAHQVNVPSVAVGEYPQLPN